MKLENQMEQELKEYLEQTHDGRYGVAVELNSREKEVEVWITCEEDSEEPEINEMFSELGQPVGILQPTKEEHYNEEDNSYHLELTEREEYKVKIDS